MNGQIKHAVGKVTYTRVDEGYRVVNALGHVIVYSTTEFLALFSPVATVVPAPVNVPYLQPVGEHPMHELGTKIRNQILAEEETKRRHLSPDTIENLIVSNLGHKPSAYGDILRGRDDRG